MKKLCALFILAASASLLNANYYGNYGDGNYGGCSGGQAPYNQGAYYPQGQQYPQGQYGQYPQGQYDQYQYSQYGQGQYGSQYSRDQNRQFQGQYGQYSQDRDNNQSGMGMSRDQYSQQGYGYNQDMRSEGQNEQLTTNKLQDSLRSSFSSKYNNVNASVNNGNVTLTGTVATQEDKNDLEKKVRGMSGVQSVNNQVRVQNQGSSSQSNY